MGYTIHFSNLREYDFFRLHWYVHSGELCPLPQLYSYTPIPTYPPLPPADAHRVQILIPPELFFILLDLTLLFSSHKWCIFFGNKQRLLKNLLKLFLNLFRFQEVPLLWLFGPHASDAEVCGRAGQVVRDQVHLRTHLRDHLHRLRCTEISINELFKLENILRIHSSLKIAN